MRADLKRMAAAKVNGRLSVLGALEARDFDNGVLGRDGKIHVPASISGVFHRASARR